MNRDELGRLCSSMLQNHEKLDSGLDWFVDAVKVNTQVAPPKIGVIAIGQTGMAVLESICDDLPYLTRSIAIHSCIQTQQSAKFDTTLGITQGSLDLEQLALETRDLDFIFVLSCLGEEGGGTRTPELIGMLQKNNIPVIYAGVMIWDDFDTIEAEGPACWDLDRSPTLRCLGMLQDQHHASIIIISSGREAADRGGLIASTAWVLAHGPSAFLILYRSIVLPLVEAAPVAGGYEVLKYVLQPGSNYFGLGSSSGDNRVIKALDIARVHPEFSGADTVDGRLIIWISCDFATLQIEELLSLHNRLLQYDDLLHINLSLIHQAQAGEKIQITLLAIT